MIGYVTLGTNDFDKALNFYDELLALIDERRLWTKGSMAAWGVSRNLPSMCISKPFNGAEATNGNGMMVAIKVSNREQVDALHAKAIELGGRDEGPAGSRGNNGFYAGYFRDLDGNKLNVYIPADSV